jgi:hypothetical protein
LKTLFTFFAICLLSLPLFAQNVGFQGKRAILKFDAVSAFTERAVAAEMEYVLNRNFAVFAIGNYSNRHYTQRLPAYTLRSGKEIPSDTLGKVTDVQFGMGVKIYFSNSMPAPKRNYFFASYQLGLAEVEGDYFKYSALKPDEEGLNWYRLRQVPSSRIVTGFGYQTFFWNRVSADFSMGIAMGALELNGGPKNSECDYNCYVAGFSDKYGPNVLSFGNWRAGKAGGLGLNLQLKIGVLLF